MNASSKRNTIPGLRILPLALPVSTLFAAFTALTPFFLFPFEVWLILRNGLAVALLVVLGYLGLRLSAFGVRPSFAIGWILRFCLIVLSIQLLSYLITFGLFSEHTLWMPEFYRDFMFHGFESVTEYLSHRDNFQDLFVLQTFSALISLLLYLGVGTIGYALHQMLVRRRNAMQTN